MPDHKPTWRKSTYSVDTAQCVEVAATTGPTLVRDSKHPDTGHLAFAPTQLGALIEACAAGTLDHIL